jgi:hypothetical protein
VTSDKKDTYSYSIGIKPVDQSEDQLQLEQEQYEREALATTAAASEKATPAKRSRKRQKTGAAKAAGGQDGTSVESELRQQSMHSLLDLMNHNNYASPRTGEARVDGANGTTPAAARVAPVPSPSYGPPVVQASRTQQFAPPSPYPCEICSRFNSRVCCPCKPFGI